jgi:hypothetical protein
MCDGFLNKKKNQGGGPDCPYHHPEGKRPNARKFTRKKKWWASRLKGSNLIYKI